MTAATSEDCKYWQPDYFSCGHSNCTKYGTICFGKCKGFELK